MRFEPRLGADRGRQRQYDRHDGRESNRRDADGEIEDTGKRFLRTRCDLAGGNQNHDENQKERGTRAAHREDKLQDIADRDQLHDHARRRDEKLAVDADAQPKREASVEDEKGRGRRHVDRRQEDGVHADSNCPADIR